MKSISPSTRTLCVLTVAILRALPALADGNHIGWCQGVYNPHHHMGCTGGNHQSGGGNSDLTPDVTPNGNPGNTQGPTPQVVTVTGETGTTVVDPQNNPGAVVQEPTTTTQTQSVPSIVIHRPRPQPVVGPPQTTVYGPTSSGTATNTRPPESPRFVDGPLMQQAPVLPPTRTPTQTPQVQAVPALTTVQRIPMVPPQPPAVQLPPRPLVVTAQPQVPVVTSNPAIPLAQQQPNITSTPQLLAQPPLPTTTVSGNKPPVAIPPGQPQQPVVVTAQPQGPVVTSNPAIPLAQQQPNVTSTPQPLAQPPLPTTTVSGNKPPVAIPPGQTPQPVVVTAQPQVPVVTSNPAIPLAQQQPNVTSTPQPLAQPPLPTTTVSGNKPPAAIPPGQTPQPVVVTAQPQVPVVTSNPAIPLGQKPSVVSHSVQPPNEPPLPPTVITAQPPVAIPPVKQSGQPQVLAQPPITMVQALPDKSTNTTTMPPTGGNVVPDIPPNGPTSSTHSRPNAPQIIQEAPGQAATQPGAPPGGRAWVVAGLGRQRAFALPARTEVAEVQVPIHCLASGFGPRREQKADGSWEIKGLHAQLRTTESIIRNIPANHHRDAGCLIEVRRRIPSQE